MTARALEHLPGAGWLGFGAFALLGLAWMLAVPVNGAPDEREHIVRAAAVARGELVAQRGDFFEGTGGLVTAPEAFNALTLPATCFVFHPQVPASCAQPGPASARLVRTASGVARYFPLYYFIVGLPSVPFPSLLGIYLMRLVSLLVAAGFVGMAAGALTGGPGLPLGRGGLALAVTPMAPFLGAMVNASGWEITAGIGLWACGLALVAGGMPPTAEGTLIHRAGALAVALTLIRAISPLWVLVIGLTLLLAAERSDLRRLLRRRSARAWLIAIAVAGLVSTSWTLGVGALQLGSHPEHLGLLDRLAVATKATPDRVAQMIGSFGWLDTPAPAAVYLAWVAGLGTLLLLGLAGRSWRLRAATLLAALATFIIPVVIEGASAGSYGFYWQGRYSLPLAAGVPLLLAAAAGTGLPPANALRLLPGFAGVVAAAQLVSIWAALVRFESGGAHPLNPLSGPWSPPGGGIAVLALAAAGSVLWGVLIASPPRRPVSAA